MSSIFIFNDRFNTTLYADNRIFPRELLNIHNGHMNESDKRI